MLRYSMKYADRGEEFYGARHRKRQISHPKWKAAKLGIQIIDA
jgi:hypothetical protein